VGWWSTVVLVAKGKGWFVGKQNYMRTANTLADSQGVGDILYLTRWVFAYMQIRAPPSCCAHTGVATPRQRGVADA
jgi:hypothetical protein